MASDEMQESPTMAAVPTDEQLLMEFQRGDRAALVAILQRHEVRLARIAYRITGCQHEAEDVRHTVLVRFLQTVGHLQNVERIGAWLTRCTLNEALTRMRQRSREDRAMAELAPLTRTAMELSPLDQLQRIESRKELSAVLATFTPHDRMLLSLRFDEGLTFQEIAQVIDCPISTVKSQVANAISRLRKALGKGG